VITQMPAIVPCPTCGTDNRFQTISMIDVDDQPDWRAAIVKRTLCRNACRNCGRPYRNQPTFAYFDRERDQWIGAFAWDERNDWRQCEERAVWLYEVYLHAQTAMAERMREAPLHRRVTFGWEALREKIVAGAHRLDDAALELLKQEVTPRPAGPADEESDLRLLDAEGPQLILGRVVRPAEDISEHMTAPRVRHAEILQDAAFREVRQALLQGLYVDVRRLKDAGSGGG
jgi:hypothetical protein